MREGVRARGYEGGSHTVFPFKYTIWGMLVVALPLVVSGLSLMFN